VKRLTNPRFAKVPLRGFSQLLVLLVFEEARLAEGLKEMILDAANFNLAS